jgi:hypothetical protein
VNRFIADIFGTLKPGLDMGALRDRISEHKNGYSFVHDKNGLDSKYLELSERVCADPVHNLMTRNGWNERAVRRFLKKEEKLLVGLQLTQITRTAGPTTKFSCAKNTALGYAISDDTFWSSIRNSRHARDVIIERFASLDIVSQEDALLPMSAVEPFECLRAPRPALRCAGWAGQACEFTSTSKERLARHCNQHGWRSDVGDREHWFRVTVQSFCPASHSPR